MKTPDKIWLIDNDDEISWCDNPDPCGLGDEAPDSIAYVKEYEKYKWRQRAWELYQRCPVGTTEVSEDAEQWFAESD